MILKKYNITKSVAFGYYQKYNNITKKYNITHPLEMLHLAITKSTTTLLKNKNITKDVAFSYYQKYNNITKKYNITKDVAFGYYQKYNNITKKIQHNPKDVAFGYYQKYNNNNNLLKALIHPQEKLYPLHLSKNLRVRTHLVQQRPLLWSYLLYFHLHLQPLS